MEPDAAEAHMQAHLARFPPGLPLTVGFDDSGGLIVFCKTDLFHLDADALNDRLAAWSAREAERTVPHASAFVSFRHAHPGSPDDATLDLQEHWVGLEPTLRLEMVSPPATNADLEAFCRLVPFFVRTIRREGRPEGWRDIDAGATE